MSKVVQDDILKLVNDFCFVDEIKDKTIMITGGNGFIGSMTIKFLQLLNRQKQTNVKVVATVRDINKVDILDPLLKGVDWLQTDLLSNINYEKNVDYIIHTACPTQSKFLANNPVDVITQTIQGTTNLLNFALKKQVKSFLFLSSMEVFGQVYEEKKLGENDLGYVDLFSARSCYPQSKRLIENLLYCYYKQYNLSTKIARLTQVLGAGVNVKGDNRVFMQFSHSVINNLDIVLKTTGKSSKNYCYITDAISALFYILFKGQSGEAYNVANEDTYISIKDLALFLKQNFNNNINVVTCIDTQQGFAPDTLINMSTKKLCNLGWEPKYDLKQTFSHLIDYIKESENN